MLHRLGRIPVIVKDRPGFLSARLIMAAVNEAAILVAEGVPVETVDSVACGFGMAMGPLQLADEVGLETILKLSESLHSAYGERMGISPALAALVQEGRRGRESGEGFYLYNKRGTATPNKGLPKRYARPLQEGESGVPEEDILDRMILAMVNEACYLLDEQVVSHPKDVDAALIFGMGFAPARGGLLRYADGRGLGGILDRLRDFEQRIGKRFRPHLMLLEMVRLNVRFYS